mmetsp:Transcript_5852/g.25920  ORF Transcript_5852/g.25920 Transcript_5852/m.25920 type:complete len:1112 (+) Transcript_5852:100-3435(+)
MRQNRHVAVVGLRRRRVLHLVHLSLLRVELIGAGPGVVVCPVGAYAASSGGDGIRGFHRLHRFLHSQAGLALHALPLALLAALAEAEHCLRFQVHEFLLCLCRLLSLGLVLVLGVLHEAEHGILGTDTLVRAVVPAAAGGGDAVTAVHAYHVRRGGDAGVSRRRPRPGVRRRQRRPGQSREGSRRGDALGTCGVVRLLHGEGIRRVWLVVLRGEGIHLNGLLLVVLRNLLLLLDLLLLKLLLLKLLRVHNLRHRRLHLLLLLESVGVELVHVGGARGRGTRRRGTLTLTLGRHRRHRGSASRDLRALPPTRAHLIPRAARRVHLGEGGDGRRGGCAAHGHAAEQALPFPLGFSSLDPLLRDLHLLGVPPEQLRLLPRVPLLHLGDEGVFALLLRVIVLVDAPLGHDRAGPRGRSRGMRADVTGAPVRRVRMGVLRLRHVHLLHLVIQRRRNLRGLLTLPERTRGLLGGRGGHARGRLGRRVRHHGRRGHDGGRGLLRLRLRRRRLLLLLRNLRGCLRLRRSVGHRRRRPRRRVARRGRARIVGSRRRGVAVRRRADQARAFAVARGVPAVEVGRRRSGARRGRGIAAARRLRLRLRLRPALVEELDLVLYLAHDGPNVALGELKLLHHLARHRVRAVRVRVEGKLHRAGVARGVADLEAEPEGLILEDATLDPEVERTALLPTALPRLALFGRRLRGEVNLAVTSRHGRRTSEPALAGVLLAAVLPLIDGRRRRGGSAARDDLVVPDPRVAPVVSPRSPGQILPRRGRHRVRVRRPPLVLALESGRRGLRPGVRSHAREAFAPLARGSRVVRGFGPLAQAVMLAAALAARFASRVPSLCILPPRVGSGFVRVETHVANRRRALRSRRRVKRGVLHGELMRAAGPGRLRLLLDGWLGLGLRLDRRLVQEGICHQLLRRQPLVDGSDALEHERSEVRVDYLVERLRFDALGDALEDLRGVTALPVRALVRDQLDDAHSERVDVHPLVVVLVVQFGRHELRGADHRFGPVVVQHGSQTEVPNLHLALVLVDKDVVALQVAVHDGRGLRVQVVQAPQDLPGPRLDRPQIQVGLELGRVLLQRLRARLGDEVDAHLVLLRDDPAVVELDDVLVVWS